jgi:hypothetical protein
MRLYLNILYLNTSIRLYLHEGILVFVFCIAAWSGLLSRGERRGDGGERRERGEASIGLTVVGGAGVAAVYRSPLRYSWYLSPVYLSRVPCQTPSPPDLTPLYLYLHVIGRWRQGGRACVRHTEEHVCQRTSKSMYANVPYAAVPYGMYLGVLCLEHASRCGM